MAKICSERERRLQKLLIPVNIVVCIICLVAALSLFFMPILKIDIGKILSSEQMMSFVEEQIDDAVDGSLEEEGKSGVDFKPVVSTIIKNVFGSAEGNISVSALNAFKVATSPEAEKSAMVKEQLLTGDGGFLDTLINSIVDGVVGMFDTDEGKEIIEEVVVSALASSLAENLPPEASAKLTKENLAELTEKFKEINDVKNREEAEAVVNSFIDKAGEIFGDEFDLGESREEITGVVLDIYDEAIESLAEKGETDFSIETIICVAVSTSVDLGSFNIEDIIAGITGGGSDNGNGSEEGPVASSYTVTEGEPGTQPEPGTEPGSGEGGSEGEQVICTTYNELLATMGLDADKKAELSQNLRTAISEVLDDATVEYDEYFAYYGYIFYAMLAFIVPWLILFLFSFFHMFAKNKRFVMWYVKLYSFLPCLIFFGVPLAARTILPRLLPDIFAGKEGPIIQAMLTGISSYTWISGICYLLLWLVSIFWAFPIKHKIRKERKACKRAPATAYQTSEYGGYDSSPSYGGDYGGGYDSSPSYGSDYSDGYSSYGSNGYGSDGYGSYDGFDDDYSSPFGSSYDDDDDYGVGSYGSYGLDDDDDDY